MISFDNTEIAFSSKTNGDLNRSYWLFSIVGNPKIVNISKSLTTFALNIHFPINWIIKPTIFKQFCGGETIAECDHTINELGKFNIGTILDYSIEGKTEERDFDATCEEIIATIIRAKGDKHIPFSVFKVTGIGRFALLEKTNNKESLTPSEQEEFNRITNRVNKICKAAYDNKVPVFIDAEESWIQDTLDVMTDNMMETYNKEQAIVFNTYQLYRHDRLEFLKRSVATANEKKYFIGAKLVRGAYMEKERARALAKNYPSPINETKEASDNLYNETLKYCVDNLDRIAFCAGTHNEKSSMYLVDLLLLRGIPHDHPHIFFAQLLGMSDHISYNLAKDGFNVAKYVPYGPVREVVPYLLRRAQENTSVKGQTGRELGLIIKEKERRKSIR